jgi:hypothetical protein
MKQKSADHNKPVYYAAMTILVEMEVRADSQEQAQALLRHKMQTFAATNGDVAVNEMTPRPGHGFDLKSLP